jgi:hypothetical protein
MNVLETIQTNPLAVSKALVALASAGAVTYFTLAGQPGKSTEFVTEAATVIVPLGSLLGLVCALLSALHFSRGPAPINPPSSSVPVNPPAVSITTPLPVVEVKP